LTHRIRSLHLNLAVTWILVYMNIYTTPREFV